MAVLHADADAFFASIEMRDDPGLRERPMVVGSDRGEIVTCANYPARAYGLHGGMPLRQALRVCPSVVVVPARPQVYTEVGDALMSLLRRFCVEVEPGSMEEAFLDVGRADPVATAHRVRRQVATELGLPLSVGVGRTKLIAKLASRRAKPDGLLVIVGDQEQRLRDSLTLAEVWGVGGVTRERLCRMGIHTVRELDGHDVAELAPVVGLAMARRLVSIALGTDDAAVRTPQPGRVISGERSLLPPARAVPTVAATTSLALQSALERLHRRGAAAATVELALLFEDGQTTSLRQRLPHPEDDPVHLAAIVDELLERSGFAVDGRCVRRARVSLTLAADSRSRDSAAQPCLPFG